MKDGFRAARHALVLRIRLVRMRDADQLDLGELVLTDHPAGIAPCSAGFGPETGRMGGKAHRQLVGLPDFVGRDIGQRHLCRRDQPFVIGTEQVLAEFGKLAVPVMAELLTRNGGSVS